MHQQFLSNLNVFCFCCSQERNWVVYISFFFFFWIDSKSKARMFTLSNSYLSAGMFCEKGRNLDLIIYLSVYPSFFYIGLWRKMNLKNLDWTESATQFLVYSIYWERGKKNVFSVCFSHPLSILSLTVTLEMCHAHLVKYDHRFSSKHVESKEHTQYPKYWFLFTILFSSHFDQV